MIDYSSLLILLNLTRRIGKTTSAIELAKKNNAILVCMNRQQADRVARDTGLQTISIHNIENLRGSGKSIVLDQDAITQILSDLKRRAEHPNYIDELIEGINDLIRANPAIALTSSSAAIRDRAASILDDNT